MCGRYTLGADITELEKRFDLGRQDLHGLITRRYNIAPTQEVLAITNNGGRRAELLRWGLIPHWAKDRAIGSRMINARAETVAEKPSFRTAFKRQRCLIPADGFYEWKNTPDGKEPMRIGLKSWEPFAFAGLWEVWRSPDNEVITSCAIVTTQANEFMEPIHNRMPVILPRGAESIWLDNEADAGILQELLMPQSAPDMEAYQVSKLVNSPRNDEPACIEPVL